MLHFCHGNVNRKPLVYYRNGPGINVNRFVKVVLIDSIRESVISPKPARDDKEYILIQRLANKDTLKPGDWF